MGRKYTQEDVDKFLATANSDKPEDNDKWQTGSAGQLPMEKGQVVDGEVVGRKK